MQTVKIQGQDIISQTPTEGNPRYDEIIEHMSTCCLCGGELDYHHETDYLLLTVREEAHCHSCGIRTKREAHTIQ